MFNIDITLYFGTARQCIKDYYTKKISFVLRYQRFFNYIGLQNLDITLKKHLCIKQ